MSREGPVALFWGVIDRRLDLAFLRELVRRFNGGRVVLIGPEQNPDPALSELPVKRIGPVAYEDLPSYASLADVLIMPYQNIPVTQAMQPLKLKEYLATGLPVVARDLPATREWSDCLDVAASAESFTTAVLARVRDGVSETQLLGRRRLRDEAWSAKSQAVTRILNS